VQGDCWGNWIILYQILFFETIDNLTSPGHRFITRNRIITNDTVKIPGFVVLW